VSKTFPIMWPGANRAEQRRYQDLGCPRWLPWELVEPARQRAQDNHDQSLETLARRGGLDPVEMVCALRGIPLRRWRELDETECIVELRKLGQVKP